MVVSFVVPVLVLAGFAYYYLRIYKKGKAAGATGVGDALAAGVTAAHAERWQKGLLPGETIAATGSCMVELHPVKAFLAHNIPILRLVWPETVFDMIATSRARILRAERGVLLDMHGMESFDLAQIGVSEIQEEKLGFGSNFAAKLGGVTPFRTFRVSMNFGNETLRLKGVPQSFLAALGKDAELPAAA